MKISKPLFYQVYQVLLAYIYVLTLSSCQKPGEETRLKDHYPSCSQSLFYSSMKDIAFFMVSTTYSKNDHLVQTVWSSDWLKQSHYLYIYSRERSNIHVYYTFPKYSPRLCFQPWNLWKFSV